MTASRAAEPNSRIGCSIGRVQALGVEHFGQTGTIPDLYGHYGIDAETIVEACLMALREPRQQLGGTA